MFNSFYYFIFSVLSLISLNKYKKRILKSLIGSLHPLILLKQYKKCIYLDYNGTTPIWPEIQENINYNLFNLFGNPSSSHIFAKPCKSAVISFMFLIFYFILLYYYYLIVDG